MADDKPKAEDEKAHSLFELAARAYNTPLEKDVKLDVKNLDGTGEMKTVAGKETLDWYSFDFDEGLKTVSFDRLKGLVFQGDDYRMKDNKALIKGAEIFAQALIDEAKKENIKLTDMPELKFSDLNKDGAVDVHELGAFLLAMSMQDKSYGVPDKSVFDNKLDKDETINMWNETTAAAVQTIARRILRDNPPPPEASAPAAVEQSQPAKAGFPTSSDVGKKHIIKVSYQDQYGRPLDVPSGEPVDSGVQKKPVIKDDAVDVRPR